ncbi:MAG: TetR/AcrR family transcriptional regulator [Candidatus Aminicenantes bacterium]|nr:TetR/AcrR family transcriptional regulator [Candidatus Aminicenantes bacterium]
MGKLVNTRNSGRRTRPDEILFSAERLFYRFGVRKTTVGDICRTAGISRMTFYKHYRDKVHIAEAVVNKLIDELTASYRRIMAQKIPYGERVRRFIELKLAKADDMSASFIKEIYASPYPALHALLRRRMEENLKIALDEYRSAQRAGHIRPDIKPEFIVAFLNIMADMVADERLTRLYATPKELGAELMNLFFYGILKDKGKR